MSITPDRAARMDALLDKQDIYECLARMSRGSDRFDRELFLSAFHPGSVVTAGPFVGTPEELFDWSAQLQKSNYTATMHSLMQQSCDLDGDSAHAETYYMFVGCMGENNLLAGGRYIDRFERRDGSWGLVMRNNFIEWTCLQPALGNPLGEIPDLHLNGSAAHDRSDASYLRPLLNSRARNIPA